MDCTMEDCGTPEYAKGLCRKHYERNRKHGSPLHIGRAGAKPREYNLAGCAECGAPCVSYGLCDKHRKRLERYGDSSVTNRIIGDDEARWWSHVDRREENACWPWTGTLNKRDGYGIFTAGGRTYGAHVWGYQHFVKPVPPKWQVDHVKANGCAMRNCVNYLRHLEAVTSRENVLRGARTKLSDQVVMDLLVRVAAGEHFATLAEEVGVNKSTLIGRIGMLTISRLEKGEWSLTQRATA